MLSMESCIQKQKSPVSGDFHCVGREGFEPSKAEPADLQSAPFDRFGIDPI